jgi:hypothetical protein
VKKPTLVSFHQGANAIPCPLGMDIELFNHYLTIVDVHRHFKSKTKVGVAWFFPSHIEFPLTKINQFSKNSFLG